MIHLNTGVFKNKKMCYNFEHISKTLSLIKGTKLFKFNKNKVPGNFFSSEPIKAHMNTYRPFFECNMLSTYMIKDKLLIIYMEITSTLSPPTTNILMSHKV